MNLQMKGLELIDNRKDKVLVKRLTADGHNALSLPTSDQASIKKYTELHSSLGCINNENPLFDLSNGFQEIPGLLFTKFCVL